MSSSPTYNTISNLSEPIFFTTKTRYQCDPLVIMSILDHHKRRDTHQNRVIGILLGTYSHEQDHSIVQITNSFPLIHKDQESENEDTKTVLIDQIHQNTMFNLHEKINSKEIYVGWYTTDTKIDFQCLNVHKSFENVYKNAISYPKQVLLCVDTHLNACEGPLIKYKAYSAVDVFVSESETCLNEANLFPNNHFLTRFELVSFSVEPSRLVVDVGVNLITPEDFNDKNALENPKELISNLNKLQISLIQLLTHFEKIEHFIDLVLKGEIDRDHKIGRKLSLALSSLPHFDALSSKKGVLGNNVQDLLMVSYLASLTQSQIAIMEKIGMIL